MPPRAKNSGAAAFGALIKVLAKAKWPDVAPGTSYGRPALNFRGKFLVGVKDPDTFVVLCPLDEKELLLENAADIYFETDHYKGWPAMLVRRAKITPRELQHRIDRAWRMKAPKRMIAAFDAERGGKS